jgi:hypothetical protein
MTWFNIFSTFIKMKNYLKKIWKLFVFLSTWVHLHLFPQIYSIFPLHKMKWFFFSVLLPRLYSNIVCWNFVNFFQNFKVWYIQTCTSLKSSTLWHLKRGHHNVLSPFDVKLTLEETSIFIAFRSRMLANIKS